MTNDTDLSPALFARAAEMLRQERDTFDQQKAHEQKWFALRLVMGYSSIVLLGAITIVSGYILLDNHSFPTRVVTAAGAALFSTVLGLMVGVWKIVLNPTSITKLSPVTRVQMPKTTDGD